jgi:hypothetical protein
MNRLIHYIAFCCILFTACSEETLPKDSPVSPDDEGVEIILNLAPQPLQAPAPATKSSTGSNNPNVLASSHGGAMDIELLAEQPDAATRAETATSPATDAEKTIDNAWIFLFDGSTDNGNDPKLIKKLYKSDFQNDKGIKLIKKGDGNTKQLFVVLANSFNPKLADALIVDNADGTNSSASKYSDLKNLYSTIDISTTQRIPMSGADNIVIEATSETPILLTVPVERIAAKVTMSVKLAETPPNNGQWTAQLCNVAPTYWFPTVDGITASFPANTQTFSVQNEENIEFTTTDGITSTTLTYYVPMNLRGTVSATSTTGADRVTNAPELATYIRLTHNSEVGNVWTQRDYYIHLGANFTTDYNVLRNTHYTYKVTLYLNAESDSRINNSTAVYVGMFGGELQNNDGVWQFTKELWVQTANESPKTVWGTNSTASNSKTNGKANTLALKTVTAPQKCFDKNVRPDLIRSVNDYDYQWYLPSLSQLMGIWAARNSITNASDWSPCWASTIESSSNSFFVRCNGGFTAVLNKTSSVFGDGENINVRCVKEKTKTESNN